MSGEANCPWCGRDLALCWNAAHRRPLTPEAFIASCRAGRPTKHLHGWSALELGKMVADLVRERDKLRALIREYRDAYEAGNRLPPPDADEPVLLVRRELDALQALREAVRGEP